MWGGGGRGKNSQTLSELDEQGRGEKKGIEN
jgi:hypothetical protein